MGQKKSTIEGKQNKEHRESTRIQKWESTAIQKLEEEYNIYNNIYNQWEAQERTGCTDH